MMMPAAPFRRPSPRRFLSRSGQGRRPLSAACAAAALLCAAAIALPVLGPAAAQQGQAQGQVLNYRDADLVAFIDDISMLTGQIFTLDPRVSGKVTVISQTPVPPQEIFQIFLETLRVQGYTAVPTGDGRYKILPAEEAVQNASPVDAPDIQGDQLVTEVFELRHTDSLTALNLLKPIVHQNGRLVAVRGSNFIVAVDYASNMSRVRQVVARIDRDTSEVATVRLRNTSADEMVRVVSTLRGQAGGEDGAMGGVTAVAEPASNTVVLRGGADAVARMAAMIRDLDGANTARSDVRVLYLDHADAEELVPLLNEVGNSLIATQPAEGGAAAPGGRQELSVGFHAPTNALVINASPAMQQAIAAVVAQLDVRRPQVLVEAIIVEVSDTAARELGLQYVFSGSGNDGIPFTATNFSNTAPNILAATGALVAPGAFGGDAFVTDLLQEEALGSFLGLNGFSVGAAGQTSNGAIFGVILNALQEDRGSNILSTPSILTLDNREAEIHVGQDIPLTTGEALGDNFENPFRTIDREEIGIRLKVKPQINEGNLIKLLLEMEVSSLFGTVGLAQGQTILSKRTLTNTVNVDDGDIVVLGGLIEHDEQIDLQKVPLLGDVPVLGELFKSETTQKRKTNLMIFLRPTILRDAADAEAATARKYDLMRAEQIQRSGDPDIGPNLDHFTRDIIGGRVPGASLRNDLSRREGGIGGLAPMRGTDGDPADARPGSDDGQ
jgi:general secretion pathway protein D